MRAQQTVNKSEDLVKLMLVIFGEGDNERKGPILVSRVNKAFWTTCMVLILLVLESLPGRLGERKT